MRSTLFLLYLLLLSIISAEGQTLNLKWKFPSGGKVAASPVMDNNVLYAGNENGKFYAIDADTGTELWSFQTHGYILGKATVHKEMVFFESSNSFYALDKNTGQELWNFDLDWDIWGYKIDHWDDIRSSAVVYEEIIYVGTSLGALIGLDSENGEVVFTAAKGISAPIRSTPAIADGKIYFGDWTGKIYCHSLESQELLWEHETVSKKYYDTFGPIASEILVNDGKVFFGARNPQMTALDANSGEPVWIKNENDSTGGWIIGSPVVSDQYLYIGGSDSFEMYALDPNTGEDIWAYNCGLNIYTKPIITEYEVIFTAGYAYWYWKNYHPESGILGSLVVLSRHSGELIVREDFSEPLFSSPVMKDGLIYFGSYDGNIYAYEYSN